MSTEILVGDAYFSPKYKPTDNTSTELVYVRLIELTMSMLNFLHQKILLSSPETEFSSIYFGYLHHFNQIINHLQNKPQPKQFLKEFVFLPNFIFQVFNKKIEKVSNLLLVDEILLKMKNFNNIQNETMKERILILKKSKEFKRMLKLENFYSKLKDGFVGSEVWKYNMMVFILKRLRFLKREKYKQLMEKVRRREFINETKELETNVNHSISVIESKINQLKEFIQWNEIPIKIGKLKLELSHLSQINDKITNLKEEIAIIYKQISLDVQESTNYLRDASISEIIDIRDYHLSFLWIFDSNAEESLKHVSKNQLMKILNQFNPSNSLDCILFESLKQFQKQEIFKEIKKILNLFKPKNSRYPLNPLHHRKGIFEGMETLISIKKFAKISKELKIQINKRQNEINCEISERFNFFNSKSFLCDYFERGFIDDFEEYKMERINYFKKESFEVKLKNCIENETEILVGGKETKISIKKLNQFPTAEKVLRKFENPGILWEERIFEFLKFNFHFSFNKLSNQIFQYYVVDFKENGIQNNIFNRVIKKEIEFDTKYAKHFKNEEFSEEQMDWLSSTFLKWNLVESKIKPNTKEVLFSSWEDCSLSKDFKLSILLFEFLFQKKSDQHQVVFFLFKILKFLSMEEISYIFLLKTILKKNEEVHFDFILSFLKFCGFLQKLQIFDDQLISPISKSKKMKNLRDSFLDLIKNPNEKIISTLKEINMKISKLMK
jgi:hypothetical protein